MARARKQLKASKFPVGYPASRDEAVLNAGGERCESVLWDFSTDGGAVSTINFGRKLPSGAVIIGVVSDEQTAVATATSITLKAGSTALTDALDMTGTSGVNALALASSATAIKLSADSELNIAIATTAATAGKVRFYVRYLLQNDR